MRLSTKLCFEKRAASRTAFVGEKKRQFNCPDRCVPKYNSGTRGKAGKRAEQVRCAGE
jgi:hypothetical protein